MKKGDELKINNLESAVDDKYYFRERWEYKNIIKLF